MLTGLELHLYIMSVLTSLAIPAGAGSAPKIHNPVTIVKVKVGLKTIMPCSASGDPKPTVTWDKDGTPISGLTPRYSINNQTNALRIFNLQLDDHGNYTCNAINKHGVDTATIRLFATVQPSTEIVSPDNLAFMEYTNQELVCRSRGLPRPFFEWLTNDHQRIRATDAISDSNSTTGRLYSIEREVADNIYESVLYFRPITYKDFGSFSCVAYNDIGHSRATVSIDVLFAPKVLSQHSSLQPVVWWEGYTVNLSCIVAGNDLPKVTWFRNKQSFKCKTLEEWKDGAQATSACIIKHRRDGGPGSYRCHSENSLGEIPVHEFHVRENFPPPEVEFTSGSLVDDEVTLTVKVASQKDTPPATYVLASYKLVREMAGIPNPEYERMGDVNAQGEGFVKLVGMMPNREYLVKVRARNLVAIGPETVRIISTGPSIQPATTTVQQKATTTDIFDQTNNYETPPTDDEYEEELEEELAKSVKVVVEYRSELEDPAALQVKSSSQNVQFSSGRWFFQIALLSPSVWIVLILQLLCAS